jgi:hypothetical protein
MKRAIFDSFHVAFGCKSCGHVTEGVEVDIYIEYSGCDCCPSEIATYDPVACAKCGEPHKLRQYA